MVLDIPNFRAGLQSRVLQSSVILSLTVALLAVVNSILRSPSFGQQDGLLSAQDEERDLHSEAVGPRGNTESQTTRLFSTESIYFNLLLSPV
jgi:hypothetical protein